MQAMQTKAAGAAFGSAKLAAALVLAAGLLAGAAGGVGAGSGARQLEPLGGCGGADSAGADRPLLAPQATAPVGVMRGVHYVGFQPE